MRLTKFFLDNPLFANLATTILILLGLISGYQLKRATYPNVDFDILKVSTTYPGATPHDVEINVTHKIEQELEGVEGIDRIRSVSLENISLLYIFVDTNAADIPRVKDDIRRAVDRVNDFPEEVTTRPKVDEIRSTNVAVIELAVSGDSDEAVLRNIVSDLEERIQEIKGIASVEKVGYRKREVKIKADPEKLRANYISLLDIVNAIKNRNIQTSGGTLATFSDSKKIITFSEFEQAEDVKDVILRSNFSGSQITIKEVATIENSYRKREILARTEQKNSINLLVRSQASGDIIDISRKILEVVENQKKGLPEGIKISVVSDFSYYTSSLLNIVKNNAYIGIFLVFVVLMVFLNTATAFWTAFGIPLSIFGAFIVFPSYDISINFISMITLILVLGLLVDDAIVVAENITTHIESGMDRIEAALLGSKQMFWPVTTTVITSILAFIPMYFMTGVTGKFIHQIPTVVIITLAFSLFESTVILPSHIAHSRNLKARKLKWFDKIKELYLRILRKALAYRKSTLIVFAAFLVFCGSLFWFKMKFILFPYNDVDIFYVIAELPEGTTLEQTAIKMVPVEQIVAQIPKSEIVSFTSIIGHHNTNVYGANSGLHENWAMITIYLKYAADRERNSQELIDEVQNKIKDLPGFKKLITEKFNDGPPVGKPITISIVAKQDNIRRPLAQEILNTLKQVKGVVGLDFDEKLGKKELRIRPNYSKMARLGITSFQLAQTLRAAFQGIVPTSITRMGEEIDYRVQLDTKERSASELLNAIQIPNNTGKLIDLSQFTEIEEKQGYELIRHYNGIRSITITGDIDENVTTTSAANKVIYDKYYEKIQAMPGAQIYFGGEEKEVQESMKSFIMAFACALVGIYFVLIVLFKSLVQPFMIIAAIPFGICGVIVVFFLHGLPISFLGVIGSIGLLGIVVNDSLIMVSHLNEKSKNSKLTLDLILEGSADRLRAVLLTTITTVAGMIPTIYGFGGYEPFIVPVVLSVAGGLIFATFITLLLIPVLYSFNLKCSELRPVG